jgi:hypothetical protein
MHNLVPEYHAWTVAGNLATWDVYREQEADVQERSNSRS